MKLSEGNTKSENAPNSSSLVLLSGQKVSGLAELKVSTMVPRNENTRTSIMAITTDSMKPTISSG